MDLKSQAAILSLFVILNGCATMTRSTLLGAAIGGLAGGLVGRNQASTPEGAAAGAVVGAGFGSLIGYYAFKDKEAKENEALKPLPDELPFVTKPKIRSMVVPDTIEGNKYIKSHKIYILDDAGSWSKD